MLTFVFSPQKKRAPLYYKENPEEIQALKGSLQSTFTGTQQETSQQQQEETSQQEVSQDAQQEDNQQEAE